MTRKLIVVLLFFFCITASAQQLRLFGINGKFKPDTLTGTIYLSYPVNGIWTRDSCLIADGAFSFTGQIPHPVLGRFSYNNNTRDFFLEPATMNVQFTGRELEQVAASGSASEIEFEEIDRKIRKINDRWQSVMDTLSAVNRRSNAAFQELKGWVLNPYFAEVNDAYLDFFVQYPQSYVTAYFLAINVIEMNQGNFPVDSLNAYYEKFEDTVKGSWYGEQIRQELKKREIAVTGTRAPDFVMTDVNGSSLSLSSFRGQYVLLDFWGSWCVPCRKGNPHLKALYHRYKDKGFDIIGIAADNDTEAAWKKAIEADGLPWHHILIDDLDIEYNISAYPTKILVDGQGIIIGRYGTDDQELDEKLASIFNDR